MSRRAKASVSIAARPSSESGITSGGGGAGLRPAMATLTPTRISSIAVATQRVRPRRMNVIPRSSSRAPQRGARTSTAE